MSKTKKQVKTSNNWIETGKTTKVVNGVAYRLTIDNDDCQENPYTGWDCLGYFVNYHRNYNLGNSNMKDYFDLERFIHEINAECKFNREESVYLYRLLERIENGKEVTLSHVEKVAIILPVYCYEHSGITISTGSFSCPWDSGQIGYLICPKSKARENCGKVYTKKAIACMKSELETLDMILQGYQYWFNLEKFEKTEMLQGLSDDELLEYLEENDTEWEETDSCGGFIGDTWEYSGMYDAIGKELVESILDIKIVV